jgi:PAS domain S-box-containing protein
MIGPIHSRDGTRRGRAAGPLDRAELLRAITETSPECIKVVARDGRLLQMNPAGLVMIEAESWKSVEFACTFDLIAPEHKAAWLANHERVCDGENLNWEFDIIGLKGTRRNMETHATPIALTDGTVGQLAVTRDVTERKNSGNALLQLNSELEEKVTERTRELEAALNRLQTTERSFELLVDSVTDYALYMLDPTGHIVSWNSGARRIKGYETAEIIGKHFQCFYSAEDRIAGIPAARPAHRRSRREIGDGRMAITQGRHSFLGECDYRRHPHRRSAGRLRQDYSRHHRAARHGSQTASRSKNGSGWPIHRRRSARL